MEATMPNVITPIAPEERVKLGIRPGDTVRVHQKIVEYKKGRSANKKETTTKTARVQIFEGLVLAVKHGTEAGATFTVRAVLSGVGVEKIFPLYAPFIEKIEIVRRSKVRRAKLYFIRDKVARQVRRQLRNMRLVNISSTDFAKKEEPVATEEEASDAVPTEEGAPEEVTVEEVQENDPAQKTDGTEMTPEEEQEGAPEAPVVEEAEPETKAG